VKRRKLLYKLKDWIIFNILHGLSSEAEVVNCAPATELEETDYHILLHIENFSGAAVAQSV
jgi:hypothetical protein